MYTKQQVREWMQQRQKQYTPPPSPEEIRRQLGPVPPTKR
jgi:hypothetical protein